jgi:hypothetical protein
MNLDNFYVIDPTNQCWIWSKTQGNGGYGLYFPRKGSSISAHRYVYELHKGPIPDGLELDHLCKNRLCVNPEHLEAVTRTVNVRRSACTKLTPEIVIEIKQKLERGLDQAYIARVHGVSQSTISRINLGYVWR